MRPLASRVVVHSLAQGAAKCWWRSQWDGKPSGYVTGVTGLSRRCWLAQVGCHVWWRRGNTGVLRCSVRFTTWRQSIRWMGRRHLSRYVCWGQGRVFSSSTYSMIPAADKYLSSQNGLFANRLSKKEFRKDQSWHDGGLMLRQPRSGGPTLIEHTRVHIVESIFWGVNHINIIMMINDQPYSINNSLVLYFNFSLFLKFNSHSFIPTGVGQCRGRWTNIKPTLAQCVVLAAILL